LKSWILVGLEDYSKDYCVTGTFTLRYSTSSKPDLKHRGDG